MNLNIEIFNINYINVNITLKMIKLSYKEVKEIFERCVVGLIYNILLC